MSDNQTYIKDKASEFPFTYTYSHLSPEDPEIMYHWHPELEMIYIVEGSATFYINNQQFHSQAGDIILIQPTFLHAIKPLKRTSQISKSFSIHLDQLGRANVENFSQRYLQPLHTGLFLLRPRIQEGMAGYDAIKSFLLEIYNLVSEQTLYYDMMLKAKLHELLYLLFKNRHVYRHYSDDNYQKYEKLKELISYINDHLADSLTIEGLADYFGYSRNQFMLIFKKHTGQTCFDFIQQTRLNKACEYLIQTDLAIAEVARKTGFNNLSNFNRQFQKHLNQTPLHFRKSQGK